ncbi:MAG: hypothetical protein ABJL67_06300 [Sulfitobacter sp.]
MRLFQNEARRGGQGRLLWEGQTATLFLDVVLTNLRSLNHILAKTNFNIPESQTDLILPFLRGSWRNWSLQK